MWGEETIRAARGLGHLRADLYTMLLDSIPILYFDLKLKPAVLPNCHHFLLWGFKQSNRDAMLCRNPVCGPKDLFVKNFVRKGGRAE